MLPLQPPVLRGSDGVQAGEGPSVEGPCVMLFPEEEVVDFPPDKKKASQIKGHILAKEKTSKFSANLLFRTILFIV